MFKIQHKNICLFVLVILLIQSSMVFAQHLALYSTFHNEIDTNLHSDPGNLTGETISDTLPDDGVEPFSIKISVDSNPTGAEILVDSVSRGITPWQGFVKMGKREVILRSSGAVIRTTLDISLQGKKEWVFVFPDSDFSDKNFTETVNRVFIEMVAVKGAAFTMGCTDDEINDECDNKEKPAHEVTVSSFYISKYPVTQKQWISIMGFDGSRNLYCEECPVENVSWYDAMIFIDKLNELTGKNYSLPTEAQWEFAARGGINRKNRKYAGSNNLDLVAWYKENSDGTRPVGQKQPNEMGIYDMSGNVYEWCLDYYAPYSFGIRSNPTGPETGEFKVLRGGSWNTFAGSCRVSNRFFSKPDLRHHHFGFRLVLNP